MNRLGVVALGSGLTLTLLGVLSGSLLGEYGGALGALE